MNVRILPFLGALLALAMMMGDASAFGRRNASKSCGPVYYPCYNPCPPIYYPCYNPCPPICYPVMPPCNPLDNQPNQEDPNNQNTGPTPPEQIHVLGVFATDDPKLKTSLKVSADRFEKKIPSLMQSSNRLAGGKINMLTGSDCNKQKILDFCNNVPTDSDDIIFVYIACHGQVQAGGKHALVNLGKGQNEILERNTILEALKKRPNQLIVLITDSCAEFAPGVQEFAAMPPSQWKQCVLKSLLLDTKGVVDINSSSPGQLAWSSNKVGALMTNQFLQIAEQEIKTIDKDNDGKISWKNEFFPALQTRTNNTYKTFRTKGLTDLDPATDAWDSLKKQEKQEPHSFSPLPEISSTGGVSQLAAPADQPAKIVLTVPAAAKVFFNGNPTESVGTERQFLTPPLSVQKQATYHLEVQVSLDGSNRTLTQQVNVQGGKTTNVIIPAKETQKTILSD